MVSRLVTHRHVRILETRFQAGRQMWGTLLGEAMKRTAFPQTAPYLYTLPTNLPSTATRCPFFTTA
ncbi:protein of unknown function [Kyrpidia spormannii]|uniref:Uncharacterized protein n=1 Tax=Kyrpidia spormannii TaxID=2055160 RepID=A0ACA8Z5K2_9BACL|nr:protein of unknown function [Kyrpidia spormannii]